jgi:hypothetical protein
LQTIVYIDGFNLYYGACRAAGRRWLNPLALAQRLLPNDEIVEVAYFTANIKRDPESPRTAPHAAPRRWSGAAVRACADLFVRLEGRPRLDSNQRPSA